MNEIVEPDFWQQVLTSGLRLAVPVGVAGMGEVIGQRSGVLNLGIEGNMALGALAGFVVSFEVGGVWLGLLAGLACGVLVGLLFGSLVVQHGADQIVTGFAITLGGVGLAAFLFRNFYRNTGMLQVNPFRPVEIPGLARIPFLGELLFVQPLIIWALPVLAVLTGLTLGRTRFGLQVRASGFAPEQAIARGVRIKRVRMWSLAAGGGLAGLAGALLSVGSVGQFTESITAGRGFVAIALVIAASWRPWFLIVAAFLFGSLQAFTMRVQSLSLDLPTELLVALPFAATLFVLVFGRRSDTAPTALAQSLDEA